MAWLNKLHLLCTIKNDITAIIYLLIRCLQIGLHF